MDMSLKELLAAVFQSLPVSTGKRLQSVLVWAKHSFLGIMCLFKVASMITS